MVDVGLKHGTRRSATASATLLLGKDVYQLLRGSTAEAPGLATKKGDVFTVAQLAGIMGAKKTHDLIPLCHAVPLVHVAVDLTLDAEIYGVRILATAATAEARTGVEMEALTAACVSALTVYDMCKAASKSIEITSVQLLRKTGGKSGTYERGHETDSLNE